MLNIRSRDSCDICDIAHTKVDAGCIVLSTKTRIIVLIACSRVVVLGTCAEVVETLLNPRHPNVLCIELRGWAQTLQSRVLSRCGTATSSENNASSAHAKGVKLDAASA